MKNQEIAREFREIAKLLEIKGENRFRVLAYEEAARQIENYPEAIEQAASEGTLRKIPGIGEGLAAKIQEYLTTGIIQYREELTRDIPPGLIHLTDISGVGPKIALQLYKELGITSVEALEEVIHSQKLQRLPRFGPKSEEKIRKGIEMLKRNTGRML
ncbi:MAG: helix-hairpin-helix domain-containing protein, partial [Atribacterota bacterium]